MSSAVTTNTVSIVVPVYKAKEYIKQTIETVINQTYTDWELILVDDNSQDGTPAVIQQYVNSNNDYKEEIHTDDEIAWSGICGSRIRLVLKKNNAGAASARNTGLDLATGRYIAFLDADDLWLPERLNKGLEHMKKTGAGFVFSAYEFGDEMAHGTGKIVHVPKTLSYKEALSRTVIFTTTTLFDTQIIPLELIHMPLVESEDTATWWQILRAGHIAHGLDEVLAIYRRPAKSLSSNKLIAIQRVWNLYRKTEGLSLVHSCVAFVGWAMRATLRRI